MGNQQTKQQRSECLNEVRNILIEFQTKYEEYDKITIPKYGLDNIIIKLSKNNKKNIISLQNFLRNLKSWRIDTELAITVQSFYLRDYNKTDIYITYLLDITNLEQNINTILNKYNISFQQNDINDINDIENRV